MLYFVGVGPGDLELITMKAAHILQEADAIAIPDSGKDKPVWKNVTNNGSCAYCTTIADLVHRFSEVTFWSIKICALANWYFCKS